MKTIMWFHEKVVLMIAVGIVTWILWAVADFLAQVVGVSR